MHIKENITRKFIWILSVIYLLILIKLVFFKIPIDLVIQNIKGAESIHPSVNIIPFKTILNYIKGLPDSSIAIKNLLGNLVLLAPFAIFLPLLFKNIKNYKQIFAYSLLFSMTLETIQLGLRLGSFDIDDLILNVIGAMLGYGCIRLIMFFRMT